jgi:hypothetical protein
MEQTMSSGTQVDLDWAGTDAGQGGAGAPQVSAANPAAAGGAYLTDEEILGLEPPSPDSGYGGQGRHGSDSIVRNDAQQDVTARTNGSVDAGGAKSTQAETYATGEMPSWMRTAAADPQHGGEAQRLWREHQEFRAAFASPEEARAIKELLPGGVRDVLTLREATQSVDRIDAAIFSGDARAQSEVVAELARANPAAFRSMFAEAARVLAGMGTRGVEAGGREAGGKEAGNPAVARLFRGGDLGDGARESLGSEDPSYSNSPQPELNESPVTNRQSRATGHEPRATEHGPRDTALESPHFDPAAYAAFERATNDAVARDVRGSIGDTLARVMPEGVAEGAARRIGEDIFNEVHRALAADRTLSEQVASVLRDPARPAGGPRFGGAEQQRVASLLAGRAKQLVPSVARRVIGEWTSTVLNTARSKAARQAAAASRVDIAAPGGSLDSMPLRQMSAREVNYASMSDEEILNS